MLTILVKNLVKLILLILLKVLILILPPIELRVIVCNVEEVDLDDIPKMLQKVKRILFCYFYSCGNIQMLIF